MEFDGVDRGSVVWPAWAVTTRIDCDSHWRTAWEAVACHKTQLPNLDEMRQWPEERHRRLWREQTYYRAFSLVNGGRAVEDDVFTGLR